MPDSGWSSRLYEKLHLKEGDTVVFLVSVAISLGAWLVTNLSRNYSCIVSVPVYAVSNLDGRSDTSPLTCDVSARCRATGFHIIKHRNDQQPVTIYFQPSDLHYAGGDEFSITANELAGYTEELFGPGVVLESFLTPDVRFTFPSVEYKKVPIQPVHTLSFKPQYMATAAMSFEPDSVVLYGEPLHLDNIDRVYTTPFSLSNLKSSIRGVVKLDLPSGVRCSASEVTYSLEVSRYVEVRSTVRIWTRNVPSGKSLSIYPPTAEVVYRCSFPLGVDPIQGVSFWIDYRDFAGSLGGRCVPGVSGLSKNILDYRLEPEVFECIETARR